jgi:hypothetical protein
MRKCGPGLPVILQYEWKLSMKENRKAGQFFCVIGRLEFLQFGPYIL